MPNKAGFTGPRLSKKAREARDSRPGGPSPGSSKNRFSWAKSVRDTAWNKIKKTVDINKQKATLNDFLSREFDRRFDNFMAKAAEYMPFGTTSATRINMARMKERVSESMFGQGRPGSETIFTGKATGYIAGKEVQNYAVNFHFKGPRNKELKHQMDQNPISKIQVAPFVSDPDDQARMFFQAGYGQKNVCQWALKPNGNASLWEGKGATTALAMYPLSWNVLDDEEIVTTDPGLPLWSQAVGYFKDGNQDIHYPVVSRHIDFQLFNSNALLPCSVKIYLCKKKTGGTVGQFPTYSWFSDPSSAQGQGKMDTDFQYDWQTTNMSNIFTAGGTTQWIKSSPMNLSAYPGMSQTFSRNWEICQVHKQRLGPMDSLNVTCQIDATEMTRLSSVILQKQDLLDPTYNEHWPYAFMIEFQGQNGLVVPRVSEGGGVVDGSPLLVDSLPTKVRFKYRKYAKVAFASLDAINQVSNYTKPLTSNLGAITEVPLGGMAGILSENKAQSLPTRSQDSYNNYADETGAAGTYYVPVYTNQQRESGAPLGKMQ